MNEWASVPLRLGIGIMFTIKGLMKVFGLFGGHGLDGFGRSLANMGFPMPMFWAYVAGYTELIGGICLIIGFGTRISAAMLFIVMMVAGFAVHLKNGFLLSKGGVEYVFIIACVCVALMILGGGKLSINKKY